MPEFALLGCDASADAVEGLITGLDKVNMSVRAKLILEEYKVVVSSNSGRLDRPADVDVNALPSLGCLRGGGGVLHAKWRRGCLLIWRAGQKISHRDPCCSRGSLTAPRPSTASSFAIPTMRRLWTCPKRSCHSLSSSPSGTSSSASSSKIRALYILPSRSGTIRGSLLGLVTVMEAWS